MTPRFEERTNATTAADLLGEGTVLLDPPQRLGEGQPALDEHPVGLRRAAIASAEKPRRRRPTRLRPKKCARLPTVREKGATSRVAIVAPPMKAWAPTRQNWCTPEKPPRVAWSWTSTWPDRADPLAKTAWLPTTQSWATCTWAMKQVVGADARHPPAARRSPVDGRALAEDVAVADLDAGGLAAELQVLGHEADRAEGEEAVALPDPGVAVDHHVGLERRAPPDPHPGPDHAEGPHAHARLEHGPRRHAGERVDLGRRQGRHLEEEARLRRPRVAHPHLALEAHEVAPPVHEPHLEPELVAGHDRAAELRVVEAHHPDLDPPRVGRRLQQPDPRRLGERLQDEDARHHRLATGSGRRRSPRPR